MWGKAVLLLIFALAIVLAVAILYGASRWKSCTNELHRKLDAARAPAVSRSYSPRELEGLPAPVQRYFRVVLQDGQPMVAALSVEHTGTFNLSETGEQWKPFTSKQRVVIHRPGFLWDARINMAPGLTVHVHDAYIAGEGILHATLFGLLPLVDLRGTPETAQGELMRFLAETAWYPTALLPSQGMHWEAIDGTSAQATLTDGDIALTMQFGFNEDGLIEAVRAEARGRTVGGKVVPTPWEGRWSHYEDHDGMRIPFEGEAAWLLPEGRKPYWRGRINRIVYEYAQG